MSDEPRRPGEGLTPGVVEAGSSATEGIVAAEGGAETEGAPLVSSVAAGDPAEVRIGGVVLDCREFAPLVAFWTAALGYVVDHEFSQFVGLAPPELGLPPLTLQRVPEPKAGKNRMHLDLRARDRPAAVARLVGLGATVLASRAEGGFRWNVLADPEGNEFCVIGPPHGDEPD